ncbi:MAG: 16S rRNA (uracil(1498)-N(3))-methyltransferase [Clostridia bacterium]|nr:16S rRNA (uracil(1498)-N(3))-methyltransferase [Clostridia bacterium]
MYSFFVDDENIVDNYAYVEGDDYNHIKNALRMKEGEIIKICNKKNGDSFKTKIEKITDTEIQCAIIEKMDSTESSVKVVIYQGLPKSDKMEYIIQKSVELGVYSIVPVEMKYCIAKMKNHEKKTKRWNLISEAAAKQSKRSIIPKIENVIDIKKLCEEIKKYDLSIVAYEKENKKSIKELISNKNKLKAIAIVIGPEGGIDESEVEMLEKNGAVCATLGKRILRTETASSAILSMIMYEYEL